MRLSGHIKEMPETRQYEGTPANYFFSFEKGTKEKRVRVNFLYVKDNHLGSVLVTVSDRKIAHSTNGTTIDYYTADITSAQDFYPFGEILPGRSFSSNFYNYGYQGSMKDDEITNVTGANFTTFYREGDTRKGQWDTPDPKPDASWSPYVMMNDNPIWFNDPLGDIVKYGGLRERTNVFFSRLFSRAYNKEFKTLKADSRIFTFNNTLSTGGSSLGGIEKVGENEFNINYTTKSTERASLGSSPSGEGSLNVLFEETKHTSNFINNSFGSYSFNSDNSLTTTDIQNEEASAHKFAAMNTPFQKSSINVFDKSNGKLYFPETFQAKLRKSNNEEIKTILFDTYTLSARKTVSNFNLKTQQTEMTTIEYLFTYPGPYKK